MRVVLQLKSTFSAPHLIRARGQWLRTKEEMRPIIRLRQNSLMILMFLWDLVHLLDLLDRQVRLTLPPGWPPAPSPAGDREGVAPGDTSRERSPLRPSSHEPQLIPIPVHDDDDDQPPQEERQRRRSRSGERIHPHAQVPREPQTQPMVIPEPDDASHEDITAVNPSSPSAGPPPSAGQKVAPEETRDLDRASEHLHIHLRRI